MLKQEWVVQLTVTSTHEYCIEAVSEDDAIAQAETLFEEGERGELLDFEIEQADGFAEAWEEDEGDVSVEDLQGLNFDGPYRGSYE